MILEPYVTLSILWAEVFLQIHWDSLAHSVLDEPSCPGEVPEPEGDVLRLLDGTVGPFHGAIGVKVVEHVEDLLMPGLSPLTEFGMHRSKEKNPFAAKIPPGGIHGH